MNPTPSQKALVIIAHGSRRASANEEFFQLVERISALPSDYAITRPALLEQAPPTLLETCRGLPEDIQAIDIYPLFFNCGRHVGKDIPAQVAEVMDALPGKEVSLLPYFGGSSELSEWILKDVLSRR